MLVRGYSYKVYRHRRHRNPFLEPRAPPTRLPPMLPQISSLLLAALSLPLPLPPTTPVRASQSPAPTPTPTPAPTIDLGYAQYRGLVNASTGVASYLGIRFAQPPIQDLRWRAPQAPTPSPAPGAQNATAPPLCPQAPLRITTPGGIPPPDTSSVSEDCLFLNVFTPSNVLKGRGPKAKLPVIVWIHGGGYALSSAATFDGTNLIQESNYGVVVVAIQYRLGIFGFLAGKAVKAGGVLNAGLLDQEFALKWVQQHITKFGGDPARVTIWGQSAGAGSVLQHVIARNGRTEPPLFTRAIASSTFLPSQHRFSDPEPEAIFASVVSTAGCDGAADALACLRAANTTVLQAANAEAYRRGGFGVSLVVPVVDGEFITQPPSEALRKGQVNGNALLAITNSNEGVIFVNQSTADSVTAAQFARNVFPRLGPAQAVEAARLYEGLGPPIEQANSIMGETIFQCPTLWFARAFRQSFKGQYAVGTALHGDDISQYFPSFAPRFFDDPAFTSSFTQSFLDFALSRAGDPNVRFSSNGSSNVTPRWARYASAADGDREFEFEMVFNRTEGGPDIHPTTTDAGLLERCAFWESVSALTAQ
ncbi:Carboxylic ester hydrolase [Pleurotus pulmonarius]